MIKILLLSLIMSGITMAGELNGFNKFNHDSEYKYESSSGQAYKYDMSNSYDRMDYQNDVSSQNKDAVYRKVNGNMNQDDSNGEHGRGAKGWYD